MRIGVLGPLVLFEDGAALSPRDRVVLAALVVGQGGVMGPERLADALWTGAEPPASWNKVVQGCIVRIRKVLGAGVVETDARGYRLVAAPDDIDARRFEHAVGRARELLAVGEPDRAMWAAEEALALWRGAPLPELEDWDPARIEATRLCELHLDAEELRIEAALRAGRHREVLADASAAVARQPLREHRWSLLARAQHQAGRQGEALRTLHDARRLLRRELGVDPSQELVSLESAILRQDPTLIAPDVAPATDVCPFRGLSSYEMVDADLFFGRRHEADECVQRLRTTGALAIVGPSGSGKSSLLRAGITPVLERAGYLIDILTPGVHPMCALESIPHRPHGRSVLVVDQCEEAITLCRDPVERRRFFDALTQRADGGLLLVGFRADRLGDLTEHPPFAALVERCIYLLTPMSAAQTREAIEAPARQAGLRFEAGLVDLLLREVEDEPGSLPLLSHALYQTWQHREGNVLTVAGYRSVGGIRGAVAKSAEQLYAHVPPERRTMLRNLVLRLVAPSTDGEPTRARVQRCIVAPDLERQQLLDELVAARLVTADSEGNGASVELAHEALVRAWPRLREWLDDDTEGQRIWRHLASAAETWDAMGRPDSELYRGARLARAVEWVAQSDADLHAYERDFVEESVRLSDSERRTLAADARRQRQLNRRLRRLVAAVTVLSVVAATSALVAFRQLDRVDREAAHARSQELAAAALAAITDSPALAKALAVAAVDAAPAGPTTASAAALHQTFAADPTVVRWGFVGEVGHLVADIDDDGRRIVSAGIFQPDGAGWTLSVADVASGRTSWSADLMRSDRASIAVAEPLFADDGEHVVVGAYWDPSSWRRPPISSDGVENPPDDVLGARIYDAATGALVDRVDLGRCGGVVSGVSDTHLLVRTLHGSRDVVDECRWRDGTIGVELVDRSSGSRRVLTTSTEAPWHLGAAMSGDGSVVAYDTTTAAADGPSHAVVLVDVATGEELARLATRGARDLDPSGKRLLVGWHRAQVWDVSSGQMLVEVDVAGGGRNADSEFAPDGTAVVSTSDDGTVRVWDALLGDVRHSYAAVGTGPVRVGGSGFATATTPDQGIVAVIDLGRRSELGAVETCDGAAGSDRAGAVRDSSVRDGSLVVAGGQAFVALVCDGDPAIVAVDADLGAIVRHEAWRNWSEFAVAPDGDAVAGQVVARGPDGSPEPGPLVVSDRATGRPQLEFDVPPGGDGWTLAQRIRWSPDGSWIAAALSADLAIWDARTGALVHHSERGASDVMVVDVIFTPDSSALISTSTDRTLTMHRLGEWDRPLVAPTTVDGAYSIGLVGFADDGATLVAIGGYRGNRSAMVRFDATTLLWSDVWPSIHEGVVTSAAMSADGGRLATGSTDGTVRVWDTEDGHLVHDLGRRDAPVRGVAIVGEGELLVADDTGIDRLTTDPQRLLGLVRGTLTRGFTESDCLRYDFAPRCPTRDELAGRQPDHSAPLGDFRVDWTPAELEAAMITSIEAGFDRPISTDDGVREWLRGFAAEIDGTYTLRLRPGSFELWRDDDSRPVCAGSVRYDAPRLSLLAERGSFCSPSVLFEADVAVGAELRVEQATMRAEFPSMVLFGTRPLGRVSGS